jgi:hypothetical protein
VTRPPNGETHDQHPQDRRDAAGRRPGQGRGAIVGNLIPMIGLQFGRWTVVARSARRRGRERLWDVLCQCGLKAAVSGRELRMHRSLSCGCLAVDLTTLRIKHGGTYTAEYLIWHAAKSRCRNPNGSNFHLYGGAGITFCDRWLNDFAAFYADMGPRPSRRHSLDRRDGTKGYEPGNCRWATRDTQNSNKRTNHFVDYAGRRLTITQAVRAAGSVVNPSTANGRIQRGWDVARAVETPPTS